MAVTETPFGIRCCSSRIVAVRLLPFSVARRQGRPVAHEDASQATICPPTILLHQLLPKNLSRHHILRICFISLLRASINSCAGGLYSRGSSGQLDLGCAGT